MRTGTYQRAMLNNRVDFTDKVVMDVGTGTGILAFFAVQAGAKKVYAVEASDVADHAQKVRIARAHPWRKGAVGRVVMLHHLATMEDRAGHRPT